MKHLKHLILLLVYSFIISACSDIDYYSHVIKGHFEILNQKQEIAKILELQETPDETKRKLKLLQKIRRFAIDHLKLPQTQSYTSYVDLKRSYVTTVVTASKPLKFEAKTWSYFFVGNLAYRGYFDKQKAQALAKKLQQENWDVSIGQVSAYSTLGWLNNNWIPNYFKDPLLNTFLDYNDANIIATLIHEMAHQKIFIAGQTEFNESFATFVEQEGLRQFLKQHYQDYQKRYEDYLNQEKDRKLFIELVLTFVEKLKQVYQSNLSEQEKLEKKSQIIQDLKQEYFRRKQEFHVLNYDGFFSKKLNNAHLLNIKRYHGNVKEMQTIFEASNQNWDVFYEKINQYPHDQSNLKND